MLTDEKLTELFRYSFGLIDSRMTPNQQAFCRLIESAACAERDARIAELTRELEEARKDEREHWENACRLMLVSRSGQITDMALAERLVGLISEDRKEKQAIRAAIKEQT